MWQTFNKEAGYKINIQKYAVILCTYNEQAGKEIRKIILFTEPQKYLGNIYWYINRQGNGIKWKGQK
jgi:hypothetical protein